MLSGCRCRTIKLFHWYRVSSFTSRPAAQGPISRYSSRGKKHWTFLVPCIVSSLTYWSSRLSRAIFSADTVLPSTFFFTDPHGKMVMNCLRRGNYRSVICRPSLSNFFSSFLLKRLSAYSSISSSFKFPCHTSCTSCFWLSLTQKAVGTMTQSVSAVADHLNFKAYLTVTSDHSRWAPNSNPRTEDIQPVGSWLKTTPKCSRQFINSDRKQYTMIFAHFPPRFYKTTRERKNATSSVVPAANTSFGNIRQTFLVFIPFFFLP